jgi:hypothetical protein
MIEREDSVVEDTSEVREQRDDVDRVVRCDEGEECNCPSHREDREHARVNAERGNEEVLSS